MALNIPISLNIENLAEVTAQVAKMTGAAGGAGAGGAARGPGAVGSFFGGEGGAGGTTAKGLGQIAKQLPGAGVLGDMGSAFKSGGIIGVGMAGVAGILGFVKQIVESSKVFQGIAGSFFKIFGAMADMFLLPFLPLAMRGMQMLMQHLPRFQEWGQKTADWIGQFISDIKSGGFWNTLRPLMAGFENWLATDFLEGLAVAVKVSAKTIGKDIISVQKEKTFNEETGEWEGGGTDIKATIIKLGEIAERLNPMTPSSEQRGKLTQWVRGKLGWGQGEQEGQQFSPTIKRGDQVGALGGIEEGVGGIMNSMEVSLARQAEKVKDYATQFQQKEVGAGGMLGVWDDEVLRGSIPDTWDSISGMYRKMDDELADEARNAEMLSGRVAFPDIDPSLGLGKIADALGGAVNNMTLSDFVLDSSVADEIENCFIMANQCVNTKFTSLADLVEGGVEAVQMGIGGQVIDLDAINNLVAQGQRMGGVAADMANQVAADLAQYVYEMSNENVPLTIDPKILSDQIIALQVATKTKVIDVKDDIVAATESVNAIVASWNKIDTFEGMDEGSFLGGQFGEVGAQFGEAAGNASAAYARIRNFKPSFKRKKQVTLAQAWDKRGLNEGLWEDSTYEQIGDTSGVRVTEESGFNFASDLQTLQAYDDQFDAGQAKIADLAAQLDPDSATYNPPNEVVEAVEAVASSMTAEQEAFVEAYQNRPDPVVHATDYGGSDFYDYAGEGMQFGGGGGGGGRRGVRNMSHSVMNISINTRASVQDILSDLRRVQHMDDASFFNSVS